MLTRHGMKGGVVIDTIIILIGFVLLVKGAMLGADTYRFIHMAQTTDGTVIGVFNYGFTLSVQFTVGTQDSVVFAQNGIPLGTQIGEHVSLYYDPANPQHAVMENFTAVWFDTFVRLLGGLILTVWGFSLRKSRSI